MSLDARLKQGLNSLVDPIDVDYELGLVRVTAVARQRERRKVMIAAFAGAAAAIALLAGGGRLADMVLGIEAPLPSVVEPDVDDDGGVDETRFDEDGDDGGIVRDENLRLDEALDETDPVALGGGGTERAASSRGSSAYAPPSTDDKASNQGDQQEEPQPEPEAREPREDTGRYSGYAVPVGGGRSACDEGASASTAGCTSFETEPGERFVEISIIDDTGGNVAAAVQIDRDGDGTADGEWTFICNETPTPVRIPTTGDAVVYVEINGGECTDGTDSNPVGGDVTAVFTT